MYRADKILSSNTFFRIHPFELVIELAMLTSSKKCFADSSKILIHQITVTAGQLAPLTQENGKATFLFLDFI